MANWVENLLDLIFPPRCEVCKKSSKEILCGECFGQIKFMKPHLGIYSAAVYEGAVKAAIHRFKFMKRKKLANPLGIVLVKYLSQLPMLDMKEMDMIVPVPLHAKRHRERGFNQVHLLAGVLSKYFGVPVLPALERQKNTKAQFDLPREERFKNINGSFRVTQPETVFQKRVLLLDDIYTTGATISECSRVLKKAGSRRVEVLTLSRAVDS